MKHIKQQIYRIISILYTLLWCVPIYVSDNNVNKLQGKTRLAIIMIVDQCAQQFMHKLESSFTGGLHDLLTQGVVYKQAYHPHGIPSTATGFTAFSTGVFAKDHGIVNNSWFTKEGKEVLSDEDNREQSAVFSKTGTYSYGRSAKNTMVDVFLTNVCWILSHIMNIMLFHYLLKVERQLLWRVS